ncbi:MAG: hypothetical protein IJN14_03935 [Ruminococcus sp.]|nr:hypothetical protein [Ruminococcus sp.]
MAKNKKHDHCENHEHHGHHKHDKPPRKKRRSGCLPLLILLLLLALAAWFLINHFGLFGFGNGNGDGKGSGSTATTSSQTEATEAEEVKLEITVSGEKYIFSNKTIPLDVFIDEAKKPEGKVVVHITCDDDAVDDTVNKLKEKLDAEKILYVEENDNQS